MNDYLRGGVTGWRGVRLDRRTAQMMDEVERLYGHRLTPSQGSWSGATESAGTHAGCGAIDLWDMSAGECDRVVACMRQVGFAAWHRTPQQGFTRHVHGIAVQPGGKHDRGCLAAPAHAQVVDYWDGRNGLANNGRDTGPRQWVGVVWERYGPPQPPENGDTMTGKTYACNLGGAGKGWVISDLCTFHTPMASMAVIDEGVAFQAWQKLAGGEMLGQGWVDHITRLPSTWT